MLYVYHWSVIRCTVTCCNTEPGLKVAILFVSVGLPCRNQTLLFIYATFLCNNFSGAFLANASNPDCIEGFGPQNVCNGRKECIGMRDELDCGKPNCMMV